jgi:hypothetical protein
MYVKLNIYLGIDVAQEQLNIENFNAIYVVRENVKFFTHVTVLVLCGAEQLHFQRLTKICRALTGFVVVFDLLISYGDLVGS